TLRFTEPLERSYSTASLADQTGAAVAGATLEPGPDEYAMTLLVPAGLPNGTYSVLWRTLSTADGHTAEGYLAFTVGTTADIAAVVIPSAVSGAGGPPQWLKTVSRWAALVGLAALLASWPIWTLVVRPALASVWRVGPAATRRMHHYTTVATVTALVGSAVALAVQAAGLPDGSFLDKLLNTVGQTRYGELWLWRIGLMLLLAVVLTTCAWWWPRHRRREGAAAWLLAVALPVPFSLIAHASAAEIGRAVAVAADTLHLLMASLWAGGLLVLSLVLLPTVRGLPAAARRGVLEIAVTRFSIVALIAWGVMGLTGFYAGWLHVGNLTALTTTMYGKALIVKVALLGLALMLASINLLVIGRRLRRRANDPSAPGVWSRRLTLTVGLEAVLVLGALVAVGQMTSLQPARDVVTERARQISVPFAFGEGESELLLAPGAAGVNHFRLAVAGAALPAETEALLRLTMPSHQGMGTQEVQLARVAGSAWEHHGSELSIAGDWELTAILRPPGAALLNATSTLSLGVTPAAVDVPGEAWRFETSGGVAGLGLLVVGIVGLVIAIFAGRTALRKEGAGLGTAALAMGLLLLLQARIDPALALAGPDDLAATGDAALLARGEAIYQANCMSCHGADLRGDGPAGQGQDPPPADFLAPHALVHADADLVYWVRNGKQGTAMPAFGETLSDEEIGVVLGYVRAVQQQSDAVARAPDPSQCTVPPRTVAAIGQLTGDQAANEGAATPASADLPLPELPDAAVEAPQPTAVSQEGQEGQAVDAGTTTAIAATTTELVACTNAGDTLRRLAFFSDGAIRFAYPTGVTPGVAQVLNLPPSPAPEGQRSVILDIRDVTLLADGRVSAVVVIDDPTTHVHPPAEAAPAADDPGATTATFVFTEHNGRWLIDEIV
nr:c-type cytochrome [Euzebyales bacterium]